jgi:hypothetical protein
MNITTRQEARIGKSLDELPVNAGEVVYRLQDGERTYYLRHGDGGWVHMERAILTRVLADRSLPVWFKFNGRFEAIDE